MCSLFPNFQRITNNESQYITREQFLDFFLHHRPSTEPSRCSVGSSMRSARMGNGVRYRVRNEPSSRRQSEWSGASEEGGCSSSAFQTPCTSIKELNSRRRDQKTHHHRRAHEESGSSGSGGGQGERTPPPRLVITRSSTENSLGSGSFGSALAYFEDCVTARYEDELDQEDNHDHDDDHDGQEDEEEEEEQVPLVNNNAYKTMTMSELVDNDGEELKEDEEDEEEEDGMRTPRA